MFITKTFITKGKGERKNLSKSYQNQAKKARAKFDYEMGLTFRHLINTS